MPKSKSPPAPFLAFAFGAKARGERACAAAALFQRRAAPDAPAKPGEARGPGPARRGRRPRCASPRRGR